MQISLTLSSSAYSDILPVDNLGHCFKPHLCSIFSSAKWFQSCPASTWDGYSHHRGKLEIYIQGTENQT